MSLLEINKVPVGGGSSGADRGLGLAVGDLVYAISSPDPLKFYTVDGSILSRATNSQLFSFAQRTGTLGSWFGNGDGSTTFSLPDAEGRALGVAGAGSGLTNRSLGSQVGAETHSLTGDENGPHAHGVTDNGHRHANSLIPGPDAGIGGIGYSSISYFTSFQNPPIGYANIVIVSSGLGSPHNNMQPTSFAGYLFIRHSL